MARHRKTQHRPGAADPHRLRRFDEETVRRFRRETGAAGRTAAAGIDEAGRGPLGGPVVAAAVVFPPEAFIAGLDDSKKLSEKRREELFPVIQRQALSWAVGVVEAEVIDRINILEATRLAARQAVDSLGCQPDLLLLDALKLEGVACPQLSIIKGDAQSQAIAAASVLAKVTRDRLMVRYDAEYPEYGFARHKGYACAEHVRVLGEIGPSTLHRLSFAGVCFFEQPPRRSRTFQRLWSQIEASANANGLAPAASLASASSLALAEDLTQLRAEINALDGFLPACEIRELRSKANSFPLHFEERPAPGSAGVSPAT